MPTVAPLAAKIAPLAPTDDVVVDYDQHHLALYASLIEADDAGQDWHDTASYLMRLDPTQDGVEDCWRSHLTRAQWIIGVGLAAAVEAFRARSKR